MTGEIAIVLAILGVAVVLFATERIRVDVVSLLVLLALFYSGIVSAEEAFSGFSNPAVITVWAIYIVSASLTHTGIADYIGRYIGRFAGMQEWRLILVTMITVGVMSAFMNNIGATAVLLPVVINLGRRADVPPSKLLIPLAFGSLLGGVTTLIGTPPNLLINSALLDVGIRPFALLDFSPMGLIIMASSILYMVTIGRFLLPSRSSLPPRDESGDLTTEYALRDYLCELHVHSNSPLIGLTYFESELGEKYDLTIMGLLRGERMRLGFMPNTHIRAGDTLIVEGPRESILQVRDKLNLSPIPEFVVGEADISSEEVAVEEIVVSQKARFLGQTLRESNFRVRYGLTVLAIWREEAPIVGRLADEPLLLGDTLLVQGRHERIEAIQDDDSFLVLRPREELSRRLHKAPINLLIFVTMISMVMAGWLHISVAAVSGAALSVLTGCLTMDEAYKSIEWKSVFLIAGMLPMGIAMEKTGTAVFLSDQIISLVGSLGPRGVLVGLFILTTVLTAFMSNAAAAVLVAPIAIQTAFNIDSDPHAFVMGVAIAASNSFVTPIGHQACVLVYGPGNYRFFDYTRVGVPLTILIWTLMIIFLPLFFPL